MATPAVAEHQHAAHPRPIAPVVMPQPRAAAPRSAVLAFSDGPVEVTPRLVAATLTTAPVPVRPAPASVQAVTAPDVEELPTVGGRRRTAALTACAIAVLGAVSTAAAILPSAHATAETQGRCVDSSAQPKPAVKVTRSGAVLQGWKQAHPHAHRSRAAASPSASAAGSPSASASTSPSPSSSASPAASASESASASPSATASASPSTAPTSDAPTPSASSSPSSNPVTNVVGSLTSAIAGVAGGQALSLGTGVYTFDNFSGANVGALLRGGLIGEGESKTVLQMRPHSSTRGGLVPTAGGTTNPLSLLKVESGSPTLRDFTLQGTSQGHFYNGLQIKGTSGAHITNVRVNAIPGNDKVNPGETFGINDFHTSGSVYSGVEIDGAGVGASALAFNSSAAPRISDSYFHNNPYSAGVALWQTENATITDVISSNNRTGFNLERTSGTVNIVRPTLENNSAQDLYVGSDRSSVKINIVDPKFTGKLRIRIPAHYWAGAQQQQRSDIHVIIGGVDRTSSVVQWL